MNWQQPTHAVQDTAAGQWIVLRQQGEDDGKPVIRVQCCWTRDEAAQVWREWTAEVQQ